MQVAPQQVERQDGCTVFYLIFFKRENLLLRVIEADGVLLNYESSVGHEQLE